MDVAKYIGLFLLKNNFVYIHGLGNLELRKKPASFNGEALQGGAYDVVITPSGSIDDNLANFIATNEQISISKASNALREFSTEARASLASGKSVEIPAIGKFAEEKGKVVFIADPHLQYAPPPLPTVRIARRQDDTPYTTSSDLPPTRPHFEDAPTPRNYNSNNTASDIPWARIAMIAGGLLLIAAITYFIVRYMNSRDTTAEAPLLSSISSDSVQTLPQTTVGSDSLQASDDSAPVPPPSANPGGSLSFDIILNTYTNLPKAEARLKKLQGFGNKVELVSEEDSSAYYIVLPVEKVAAADTARLMDSLKRTFNPTYGVRILQ